MSTHSRNWLKFSALIGFTFLLGVLFSRMLDLPASSLAQDSKIGSQQQAILPVQAPHLPEARSLSELSDAYAAVTDAVRPSVVFIMADSPEEGESITGQLPPGIRNRPGFPADPRRRISSSIGSGFIVSQDGYILTNHHVIEGANKIIVRLLDGRSTTATLVGSDKATDIGVLKIDLKGLTPAALGSSDKVRVGEWVLAIGNPLGDNLTFSVTQGIVSAKGRGIPTTSEAARLDIHDFIQTDAAINQGNSGGPLLNVRGEVIGINSAIASTTGSYQGYAFAIPIDLASQVMNQIITHGKFERSLLQIQVADADVDDAAYLGLPTVSGVLVTGFPADGTSPAKQAGMLPGDVIVAIDGKPVKYTAQLQQIVGFHRPGETLKIEVVRKSGHKEFSVRTVGSGETDTPRIAATPKSTEPEVVSKNRLGILVEPLTAAMASRFGAPAGTTGLLVKDIVPGVPAEDKLRSALESAAPDVITEVEGRKVRTEDELRSALSDARNGVAAITLLGRGTIRVRLVQ